MELLNSKQALLDKAVINNFTVVEIEDMTRLQRLGIVSTKENASCYLHTKSGERYNSIKIEQTPLFISFTYAISKEAHPFGELEINVTSEDFHNLNCITADEYRNKLEEIRIALFEVYGITVDFTNATFKSLEINKTILLDDLYPSYRFVLSLMMYLLPGTLRLGDEADYSNKAIHTRKVGDYSKTPETFYKSSGKRGITVKIYDKKEQLETGYQIILKNNYLRYEITLKSSEKIKKALGTSKVAEITDEQINRYYSKFITKNIIEPYNKFITQRNKELKEILLENYKPASRTWITGTLSQILNNERKNGIVFLLDISELLPLLDSIPFKSKQIKANAKKSFIEECEKTYDCYIQNDNEKYDELMDKLR